MDGGFRYRVAGIVGTAALSLLAVSIAEIGFIQQAYALIPIIGHLPFEAPGAGSYHIEVGTVTVILIGALAPLYKPRPRRILDIGLQALRRVAVGLLALAAIGYFDFSFRLPRATLIVAGTILLTTVPVWFVLIRRRPHFKKGRTIIIGDDPVTMRDILAEIDGNVLGYVSPPSAYFGEGVPQLTAPELADGGIPRNLDELACLGGLSRLDEILVEYDVGAAVLAFAHPDRAEFFGALNSCYEHGVIAKVHRDHADVVLTSGTAEGEIVDIDLEPWDWQDHVAKRTFDIMFAGIGLLVSSPLFILIAIAIKIDSSGPIFYRQTRTAAFGDTFTAAKFRTMVPESENASPVDDDENDRITRVGRILRRTHLDEIPQLLAILRGHMSVVGPRAAWVDEESVLESQTGEWRRRWFVKPGLTGLAQINDLTSTDPEAKLRFDIEYIRNQSFWYDLKIVVRQIWKVLVDTLDMVSRNY
jgi:lipopolysaccharide/colanic/teichoic acid biosynthesis glycosyltransferase